MRWDKGVTEPADTFLCENANKNHELGTGFKSLYEISNDNGITVVNSCHIQKSNCQEYNVLICS
jgi:hypothetical protein